MNLKKIKKWNNSGKTEFECAIELSSGMYFASRGSTEQFAYDNLIDALENHSIDLIGDIIDLNFLKKCQLIDIIEIQLVLISQNR